MTTTHPDHPGTALVTPQMRAQFREEGYFVLEEALSEEELELLRGVARYSVEKLDAEMDEAGVDSIGINHRGKRYFSAGIREERPELKDFLFGAKTAEICRATLGDDAYLFLEQYVIKASDPDTAFSWHQDSGYIHEDHDPYVTVWIALDDITPDNGPVHLLPYSRSGIRSYVKHIKDPATNDQVGYFGSDPGLQMTAPAGSIVVFSSVVLHRSGPNLTDSPRRVYIAQYTGSRITWKDGTTQHGAFEPFLKGGEVVAARP